MHIPPTLQFTSSVIIIVVLIQVTNGYQTTEATGHTDSKPESDYYDLTPTEHLDYDEGYFRNLIYQLYKKARSNVYRSSRPTERERSRNRSNGTRLLSPVLMVPGYGGSRLEARIDNSLIGNQQSDCLSTDWSTIWLNVKLLAPWALNCLIRNFRLHFDPSTNTTHNTNGVLIRVKNPESLETIERITDSQILGLTYFGKITSHLIDNLEYQREVNIRGAPFDFRKAPNELDAYFINMGRMIEQMFANNYRQRVTLICHSMGCNNVLYFLHGKSKHWKDQHIRRLISLAAPWGGSMNALRAVIFGDNLHLPYLLDPIRLRAVQRSLPGTMYMLPNKRVFGHKELIKIHTSPSTTSRRETITADPKDYRRMFQLLNYTTGYKIYEQTMDLLQDLRAPEVELWCIYGMNTPTLSRMNFLEEFYHSHEEQTQEDGDGTVASISSKYCSKWIDQQQEAVYLLPIDSDHIGILKDSRVREQILAIMSLYPTEPKRKRAKEESDNTDDETKPAL